MSIDEEGKETTGKMYGSYAGEGEDKSSRQRWIIITCIVACIGICVIGFFVKDYFFKPDPGPYGNMVNSLHPGMSKRDVVGKLGIPARFVHTELDGKVISNDFEYTSIGTTQQMGQQMDIHFDKPLIISFDNGDIIQEWCFQFKCHKVD